MRQLCQLNLQLAFVGARALSEDIENQPCTGQHSAREDLFKIALLTGAQCVIENHQLGLMFTALGRNFF